MSADMKGRIDQFTSSLHDVIGDHNRAIVWGEVINEEDIYYDAFFDNSEELEGTTYPSDKDLEDVPLMDQNNNTMKDLDKYIGAQVVMPGRDGIEVLCHVKGWKWDVNGEGIGQYNPNTILDTRIFKSSISMARLKNTQPM